MIENDDNRFDFTFVSLGAGVQSTALLVLSQQGLRGCPTADAAIFADTGDEPSWVYEYLKILQNWSRIPIYVVTEGCLSSAIYSRSDQGKSFAAIPAYSRDRDGKEVMLRRQCTREFKLAPIHRKVRELMGYKKGQRIKGRAKALIGISLDEVSRSKPSREHWVENSFPLIDAKIHRSSCFDIIQDAGLPPPKKSSCVFCPYHTNRFWLDLKQNHKTDWDHACDFDDKIRNMSQSGSDRPAFLHRSCVPLRVVNLDEDQIHLDGFENECEGYCGV